MLHPGQTNITEDLIFMSTTTMPNMKEIKRTWYILDAEGKSLGRVAAQAAAILRGKHKPTFAPHADCGDHVIIINCAKAVLTGKKLENKYFYWHTGWIGGSQSEPEADERSASKYPDQSSHQCFCC